MLRMQLVTGTVVNGKIIVEGPPLPEGTVVTLVWREVAQTFTVPSELEADLEASLAEADSGTTVSSEEVLLRLRRNA